MFTWLLQSAKPVLLKRFIQDQGNDFQNQQAVLLVGEKIQSRDHQCFLTPCRGSPSSISLLVPGIGSLVGSYSFLLAVIIPSLVHLFSKGSGHIPRHHLPGGGGGGGGKCSNIRSFLNKKKKGESGRERWLWQDRNVSAATEELI